MIEKQDYTDRELEAYLNTLELVEPPKAMAGEIIDRAGKQRFRETIFLDSRVFKVILSLSACFVLLFTGTFQSIVSKTIQYNGQLSSYVEQQTVLEQQTLQEKFDKKIDKYQQKIDKGLERYEKK